MIFMPITVGGGSDDSVVVARPGDAVGDNRSDVVRSDETTRAPGVPGRLAEPFASRARERSQEPAVMTCVMTSQPVLLCVLMAMIVISRETGQNSCNMVL
jgi:hypothetical protein